MGLDIFRYYTVLDGNEELMEGKKKKKIWHFT